jgi:hypothetical protein
MSISSATAEAEAVTKVYDKDPGAAVVGVWESAITADAGGPDHGVLTTKQVHPSPNSPASLPTHWLNSQDIAKNMAKFCFGLVYFPIFRVIPNSLHTSLVYFYY